MVLCKLLIGTLLLITIVTGCGGSNPPVSTSIAQASPPIPSATPSSLSTSTASPTPIESLSPTLPAAVTPTASPTSTESISPTILLSPAAGANTILVGHLFNIQAAANVSLPEGGAAIFEPLGQAGFRLIARVSADEWSALAQP